MTAEPAANPAGQPRGPLPTAARSAARARKSVLWHACAIVALLVLLYPIVWLISASFKPADEVLSNLSLLPRHPTADGYHQVFSGIADYSVWHYFGNSLLVSVGAVAGNVISCSLAAYAFARLHFRGRGPLFGFVIATIMLPQHAVLIPQYILFQKMGLVNTFWPLILPKFLAVDAFFVFLMVQFIRTLPRELDEAATLDGCGPLRIFRHIIVPLLRPALITTAILTFIWTWNDFFTQLVYLNDADKFTLPLALQIFIDQTGQSAYGPMLALSVLALVPIALFFLAFQRFLLDGATNSGLKG
ncbi:carbohydrate ABC transporter permease [Actinocrinis sp.]|uniref:carbohydrate ABC transporter permease n=1 Tax=Actinocrinis sp. TaxID=1920516 RepID=UPI002D299677|nr:carbohydrate ABC transporter permease [Actinocrinis sp.]HZP50407.1 carbohydrate ABC transporter permease [Actinocrinis sp.]